MNLGRESGSPRCPPPALSQNHRPGNAAGTATTLRDSPTITINEGRPTLSLDVLNTGDRPIQVGSHFHFAEVNSALSFDRQAARGFRLDIPAGTAVRFEPGDSRPVHLVALAGARRVFGLAGETNGPVQG